MKKVLLFLTFACLVTTNADAQFSSFTRRITGKKQNTAQNEDKTQQNGKKKYHPFLPLGIEELKDNGPRTKGRYSGNTFMPDNKDATRYLWNAVQENDVSKVEKLLKAGASAYVDQEMVKKKQFEIMDLMFKDNPQVIRYSQLLHYAAFDCDSTMIDFLVDRGASFDLCGYCEEKGGRGYYGADSERANWNGDNRLRDTPADVALYYRPSRNLYYIINKYHKYPTINGCAKAIRGLINYNIKLAPKFLSAEDNYVFLKEVDYTMAEILNFGDYQYKKEGSWMLPKVYFPINDVVSKIAESRRNDKAGGQEYVDVLKLMVDKGADVNVQTDEGGFYREMQSFGINLENYVNTTPMYIAMQNKNMMDIIQYLRSKGAKMTVIANGKTVSILKLPGVLDEYKEYFMIEGL